MKQFCTLLGVLFFIALVVGIPVGIYTQLQKAVGAARMASARQTNTLRLQQVDSRGFGPWNNYRPTDWDMMSEEEKRDWDERLRPSLMKYILPYDGWRDR